MASAPGNKKGTGGMGKLPFSPAPASLWRGEGPIVKSGSTGDSAPEDTGTATDKG